MNVPLATNTPADPVLDDWAFAYQSLSSGELAPCIGKHVVIFQGRVIAAGENPQLLRHEVSERIGIEGERLVVLYVDCGEGIISE